MPTISVTRGLSELKMLNTRITDAVYKLSMVTTTIGKKPPANFASEEEFKKAAESSYQSITDLIARRAAIKSAIVKSNAVTMVTIGDKSMTVAEAIERKISISHEQMLLQQMKQMFVKANNDVERNNRMVDANLQKMLEGAAGKDGKMGKDDIDNMSRPYHENNDWKIVDPLGIQKKIEKLENDINEFLLNADTALSEINARTDIEIVG